MKDAAEVQALIKFHCEAILERINAGGLKPNEQPILLRTCERIVDLAKILADCRVS